MSNRYDNINQIEEVVRGFETCSTSKEDFNHSRHLTIALWYLSHNTFEEAADLMRTGLFRFIKHHNIPSEKYNETITLFWLRLVRAFAEKAHPLRSGKLTLELTAKQLVPLANELIQTFASAKLMLDYYSERLMNSTEAKRAEVAPDRKQFDF